jgi:hypothetical protein
VRICAAVTENGVWRAEELLVALAAFSRLEGDFPWHAVLHPTGDPAAAAAAVSACLSLSEVCFDGSPRCLILTETETGEIPDGAYAVFSAAAE